LSVALEAWSIASSSKSKVSSSKFKVRKCASD
jgi:hypothetical protein